MLEFLVHHADAARRADTGPRSVTGLPSIAIRPFDEVTCGIDIGAEAEIYTLLERLAAEGKDVIVVSSELPEILRVSDRVRVMREGRVAAELPREALSEAAIAAHAVAQSGQVPRSG